ncbi:hypothetical protein GGH98_003405, partial [Coemansia sp. RSA 454]
MRGNSAVAVIVVAAVVALTGTSHAAPFPSLARRQADFAPEVDPIADPVVDSNALVNGNPALDDSAAWTAPEDSSWADPSDTIPDSPTNNNLVGNSLTQIDDSVNVSNTDIDYPDNSELTGNT